MRKVGVWSRSYSETPHRLKSSKKYNRFMNRKLQNIDVELERILDAMGDSDLTEEKHHELVQSYEKLTKVKLLLEGKPTEITELTARQLSDAELDAEIAKLEGYVNPDFKDKYFNNYYKETLGTKLPDHPVIKLIEDQKRIDELLKYEGCPREEPQVQEITQVKHLDLIL